MKPLYAGRPREADACRSVLSSVTAAGSVPRRVPHGRLRDGQLGGVQDDLGDGAPTATFMMMRPLKRGRRSRDHVQLIGFGSRWTGATGRRDDVRGEPPPSRTRPRVRLDDEVIRGSHHRRRAISRPLRPRSARRHAGRVRRAGAPLGRAQDLRRSRRSRRRGPGPGQTTKRTTAIGRCQTRSGTSEDGEDGHQGHQRRGWKGWRRRGRRSAARSPRRPR